MSGVNEALDMCRECVEAGEPLTTEQGNFLFAHIDELQARLDGLEGLRDALATHDPA